MSRDDRPAPRGVPGHRPDHALDLVVLGTGAAAAAAAHKCRAAGWRVAVVDSRPFGGTCALRGCDPKKVLVGAAELVDWGRRSVTILDRAGLEALAQAEA